MISIKSVEYTIKKEASHFLKRLIVSLKTIYTTSYKS